MVVKASLSRESIMKKILLIDDDRLFLDLLTNYVRERYPDLEIITCNEPLQGLAQIDKDLDLLLLDLEMPKMDGGKLLSYAIGKGLDRRRIIILSGRDADYLHERFAMGECLAVLNKNEARQKVVLDMIFDALQKK
jgi:CheY-like chemotaxis protein